MTSDGMPSNSVFDIAQDPSGMMWFMTKSGPSYYDAKQWHSFPDSLNLPSSNNSKIASLDSIIWVAGLNKTAFTIQWYKTFWTPIEIPFPTKLFNRHFSLAVMHSSAGYDIIIGAGNHLFTYNTESKKWKKKELTYTINGIKVINNKCYLATTDGLWTLDDFDLEKVPLPYEKLPTNNLFTLESHHGKLLLLGLNWYAEIENDEVIFLLDDVGLTSSSTTNQSSLVVDLDGRVFFGSATPARSIDYENQSWNDLLIKGANLNIGSTRIFCDRENNIWVSDSRGLFKFNVLQFQNYNKSSGLADDEVSAILQLSDGSIVLANPLDFNILNNGVTTNYSYDADKTLTFRILAMAEDSVNNLLYMATNDLGLLVYSIGNYSEPLDEYVSKDLKVTSVKLFQNTIYVAANNGLYYLDNGKIVKFDSKNGIRNICVLGNKLAFLSNSDGVFMYDGTKFIHYTSKNFDLASVYQGTIYNGDTLLATRDGIGIIQNGEIQPWKKINIRTPMYSMLVDNKNRLWIGGDNGIYQFDGINLDHYNTDEGLSGNEVNRNAMIEDLEGQIWIGTEKGASVFKDESESKLDLNLKVDITEVWINQDKRITSFNELNLPYDQNDLRIVFQCLSYVDEGKINFRYSLNPKGNKWIRINDASSDVIFSNLESGEYTFTIQARYGNDEWGPSSSFNLKVNKPFYFKWWFILLAIILLALVSRVIFYFRYLYLIRKQRKLQNEVNARTKEITILNQELENKVRERTIELEDKNQRLEDSAYVNAHHLRGPLTKMMSALHFVDLTEDEKLDTKMIQILKDSVQELDEVIHSINEILKENKA